MNKITPKQQRFVSEYLIDLNATQAAIRAGYAKSGASVEGVRLLANAKVAAAVAAAVAKRSERTEITQDYVLASIMETMERCKQAEPVKYKNGDLVYVATPSGDLAPAYKFNATAVLKGSELLGRHLAMFTDKLVTKNAVEDMTDEELDAEIAKLEHEDELSGRRAERARRWQKA